MNKGTIISSAADGRLFGSLIKAFDKKSLKS